ncbi:MAG: hypothetical protein JWO74_2286 [Solirubrobacterales bacterium]|nr:hypothetical protein [Solirubrobacterales bacterium]
MGRPSTFGAPKPMLFHSGASSRRPWNWGEGTPMLRRTAARVASLAFIGGALVVAGCGGGTAKTRTVTVTQTRVPAVTTASTRSKPAARSPRTARTTPVAPPFVACDASIEAKAGTTTCGFAQNVFWAYWTQGEPDNVSAYSPATKRTYAVTCSGAPTVVCRAGDGGQVRFPMSAVAAYDQGQADVYAASHDVGPDGGKASPSATTPAPTYETPATPTPSPGDSGPNPSNEIPNYDNGTGYPVQCADGMWSQSGGRPGACSGHGGEG